MPLRTDVFDPADTALEARLSGVDIDAYSKTRNHLNGKVTRLSPFITHGLTSIPELFAKLPKLQLSDKLAFEFGWREFFHHVWSREGERILSDMRPALPGVHYSDHFPQDIREGRTGLAVIDRAVHQLYATGYLHNHARMWLASYVVHLRKVHWRVGADWMFGYLLDGDLASNHLSWQWVAATFSSKPYLLMPRMWRATRRLTGTAQAVRWIRATSILTRSLAVTNPSTRCRHWLAPKRLNCFRHLPPK